VRVAASRATVHAALIVLAAAVRVPAEHDGERARLNMAGMHRTNGVTGT
jgi:hypothetical protein